MDKLAMMSPIVRCSWFCAVSLLLAVFVKSAQAYEWQTPPDKITLLSINAHPDDEGIFFGGALPYYSGVLQVPTMILSMTSGDWNTNNLPIREDELRKAAWIYGLRYEPLFARFRDVPSHSMTGNPYPNKIDATWDYWADGVLQGDGSDVAKGKAKAVNYVAEVIRRYRPEVIITHDFNGEYGHDNHKATAIVVAEAYYVAGDPNATATNLVGLAPWLARKLYCHLYNTNRLFHTGWEDPCLELGGKTCRAVANEGLDAHVSQNSPDVSTYYLNNENYNGHDSERWGLFATTVGLDTVRSNGMAYGNFLENLDLSHPTNRPPMFFPLGLKLRPAVVSQPYSGQSVALYSRDPDKVSGDIMTFSKVSGPSWLNVASTGALQGTPGINDLGENVFTVRVTDSASASDEVTLRIFVGATLAAAWNFNEGGGTVARDSTGEGHHATLTANGAVWMAGREGSALKLDGTNGFGTSDNVNVGNAITAAGWFYSENLVGEHSIVGEAGGYILKTSGTSLRFTIPGVRDHSYTANFALRQWYHVAVSFEAGVSNGCKFYINGQFRASAHASTKSASAGTTWIGRNQWGQHFSGLLDDVRVYRGVLDAAEIAALYDNRPPAFSSDPLLFPGAVERVEYTGQSLIGRSQDPDTDPLTYHKLSGPNWLLVSRNGALAGTPGPNDVGTNVFEVQVADRHGAADTAMLRLVVAHDPSFTLAFAGIEQGHPRFDLTARTLQSYEIQCSTNLIDWTPVATVSTDNTGRGSWLDPRTPAATMFYRFRH